MSYIVDFESQYPHIWDELLNAFCSATQIAIHGIGGVIYTSEIKTNEPVEVTGP